MENIFLCD